MSAFVPFANDESFYACVFEATITHPNGGPSEKRLVFPAMVCQRRLAFAEADRRKEALALEFKGSEVSVKARASGEVPAIAMAQIQQLMAARTRAQIAATLLAEDLAKLQADKSLAINPNIPEITQKLVKDAVSRADAVQQEAASRAQGKRVLVAGGIA